MKIPFRHGIVRHQSDINHNPTFLLRVDGGSKISLIVSPDPTVIAIANGTDIDYLFEERVTVERAWGPFSPNIDYWLYWDIDILTGLRTFGHTTLEPKLTGPAPSHPANDQHWFDASAGTMKVWQVNRWIEKIRVFACKYDEGSTIIPYPLGSQVGLNSTACNAGFILYDTNDKPIRRSQMDGKGKFFTTESKIVTQSSGITTVSFETSIQTAEALEYIPAFYLVCNKGPEQIGVASNTDTTRSIIGMVREDMYPGEVQAYVAQGYVTNPAWNWSQAPATPLFCGPTGEITTTVPQQGSLQRVGEIVSPTVIYLNIFARHTYM